MGLPAALANERVAEPSSPGAGALDFTLLCGSRVQGFHSVWHTVLPCEAVFPR